jgi:twitching motility protein PilU
VLYLQKILSDWKDRNRAHPHFLTYEDPIEVSLGENPQQIQTDFGIDYTARQKTDDTGGLKAVVQDALRQTPSLLFVGEVRERSDWRELLHYAATGHLAMTTTHAGSLTETMSNVLQSVNALSLPASRGQYSNRIHALIHLKKVSSLPYGSTRP